MTSQRDREHIFERLRSGVVPERGLEAFAVGIERQRAEIQRLLDLAASGEGVFKFLRGGYGCGKTFMARLALLDAQAQGVRDELRGRLRQRSALSTSSTTSTGRSSRSSGRRRVPAARSATSSTAGSPRSRTRSSTAAPTRRAADFDEQGAEADRGRHHLAHGRQGARGPRARPPRDLRAEAGRARSPTPARCCRGSGAARTSAPRRRSRRDQGRHHQQQGRDGVPPRHPRDRQGGRPPRPADRHRRGRDDPADARRRAASRSTESARSSTRRSASKGSCGSSPARRSSSTRDAASPGCSRSTTASSFVKAGSLRQMRQPQLELVPFDRRVSTTWPCGCASSTRWATRTSSPARRSRPSSSTPLVDEVTKGFGGDVGVVPRQFLRSFVNL